MNLTEQVRQSKKLTGSIQVQHPYQALKTIHRVPQFKQDGVYVHLMRGLYKVVGYKKVGGILDVYEVE